MVKVQTVEGIASQTSPESCAGAGDRAREALTGVRAGRVLSHEMGHSPERRHRPREWKATLASPGPAIGDDRLRVVVDPAHVRTHVDGNRESLRLPAAQDGATGRIGKPEGTLR